MIDNNIDDATDLGFLAIDGLASKTMTGKQAQMVKNGVDNIKKKDRLVWNRLCPRGARRRLALPRGCRTFFLEIFSGCAMLSTLAHDSGLPVSQLMDIRYDPVFDLKTEAGRHFVEGRIAEDDSYLTTFGCADLGLRGSE